jgi:hypothetical protein
MIKWDNVSHKLKYYSTFFYPQRGYNSFMFNTEWVKIISLLLFGWPGLMADFIWSSIYMQTIKAHTNFSSWTLFCFRQCIIEMNPSRIWLGVSKFSSLWHVVYDVKCFMYYDLISGFRGFLVRILSSVAIENLYTSRLPSTRSRMPLL